MAISVDSLSLQPFAPVFTPSAARADAVQTVGQRESAGHERRDSSRERSRAVHTFRAALNTATLRGLGEALGGTFAPSDAPPASTRAAKVPDAEPVEISGTEAAALYTAAQEAKPRTAAPEFQAAASQYAKNFFSVAGTFARPGESLELTA